MSVKAFLYSGVNNALIFARQSFNGFPSIRQDATVLHTTDFVGVYGRFQSATRTTAGTTQIVAPITGGSIIVTDIIIGGEKQASSTAEIRFADGTNNATIFLASQVDAPPNIAHQFRGRVQGWVDARIDLITSGAGDATATVCYVKLNEGIPFAEWNALR